MMRRTTALLVVHCSIVALAVLVCARSTQAAGYYVAVTGSDSNAGTLAAPFQTIQKAATVAAAGDTVYIRAGTYRETVTPAHSGAAGTPIAFRPYKSEKVTVSGADIVKGWSNESGSIYQALLGWDLGTGNNQMFVDGQMVPEARCPNTGLDPMRPKLAQAGSGTTPTEIDDPQLTQPAGYWNGATLWVLGGNEPWEPWIAETSTVTSSSPGKIDFNALPTPGSDYDPAPGDYYFLTNGPASSLDSPGEWRLSGGSLNLWLPDSGRPVSHTIEAKHRLLAFDLSNHTNIQILDISVFASSISMSGASHCLIQSCHLKYLSHFTICDKGWDTRDDTGIVMSGAYDVVRSSTVEYSAGNGITVLGGHNQVVDSVVRGCDYAGTDSSGIRVTGSHQLVESNTVFECGRCAILNRVLKASSIDHNDMSFYAMMTKDVGGTYCWETDGKGTVIAYNIFHDAVDALFPGHKTTAGPYLDNGTTNTIVHHNLVYNVDEGTRLNPPNNNNLIYNNTFANNSTGSSLAGYGDLSGDQVINDIFVGVIDGTWNGAFSNDLYSSADPKFVDPGAADFRLQAGSPAFDAGMVLPPYTNGYLGAAPDIGSLEYGATAWKAGSSLAPAQPQNLTATTGNASVTLSWSPSGKANSYKVWMRSGGFGPFILAAKQVTATGSTIGGLSNGTAYEFAVAAVGATTESEHSASVFATPAE